MASFTLFVHAEPLTGRRKGTARISLNSPALPVLNRNESNGTRVAGKTVRGVFTSEGRDAGVNDLPGSSWMLVPFNWPCHRT